MMMKKNRHKIYTALENFRDLKISRAELLNILPKHSIELMNNPVIVEREHIINMLTQYKNGKISKSNLVDWVNIIWFKDFYDCPDEYCDSMASVMDKLEELDEDENELNADQINFCIETLQQNNEIKYL